MSDSVASTTTIPGPWGLVHLAATDRGVVAVEWLVDGPRFEAGLRQRLGGVVESIADDPDPVVRADHLSVAVDALVALLAGRSSDALPRFDLTDRPGWDRHVLLEVAEIPWGVTASYGDIARRIGSPRAARAVGGALGRNPISLLIPCHRIIAADGGIGGYGGDAWGSRDDRLAIKRDLLLREGVTVTTTAG
jgi:methylated-DNA-[protein]-cysteine S-methyltransferase